MFAMLMDPGLDVRILMARLVVLVWGAAWRFTPPCPSGKEVVVFLSGSVFGFVNFLPGVALAHRAGPLSGLPESGEKFIGAGTGKRISRPT